MLQVVSTGAVFDWTLSHFCQRAADDNISPAFNHFPRGSASQLVDLARTLPVAFSILEFIFTE